MIPKPKTTEKVIYLKTKDEPESVKYLKEVIAGIQAGVVKKVVCITDCTVDLSKDPDMKLVDEYGNELELDEDEKVVHLTNNFFMGDGPVSELIGLTARLTHIMNQYLDNYRFIGDE